MKVLFLHHNYPAQFKNLVNHLVAKGDHVTFVSEEVGNNICHDVNHIKIDDYNGMSHASLEGQLACADRFYAVLKGQFEPTSFDLIISHTGWGCGLHTILLFPATPKIAYSEWWFRPDDSLTSKRAKNGALEFSNTRLRNCTLGLEMSEAAVIVTPTQWQRSRLPIVFKQKAVVIHDGIEAIDVDWHKYNIRPLNVAYATRGLEKLRGFDRYMKILPLVLEKIPYTIGHIVGNDQAHYIKDDGKANRVDVHQLMNSGIAAKYTEAGRIRYHGFLSIDKYNEFMSSLTVYFYISQAFVPSWGLITAMMNGCIIVASDNTMNREILGSNGIYVKGEDSDDVTVNFLFDLLSKPVMAKTVGEKNRTRAVELFEKHECLEKWDKLIKKWA